VVPLRLADLARPGCVAGWRCGRPAGPADRAEVLALDRAVFGASRAASLGALARLADRVVVATDARGLAGHGSAWRNLSELIIGPVVARDDVTALALIQDLAARAGGPVRVDLPARHAGVSRWLAGRGVRPAAPDPLMSYGGKPLPGDRDRLYGLFMQGAG
jgi:hypothetical protein